MELIDVLRTLRSRWRATALVVVLAVGAAGAIRATAHSVPTGASTVQLLVDSPSSELANLNQNPTPLISRAGVFAQVMTSQAVLQSIATSAGVPSRTITAQGPYSGAGESLDVIVPAEGRSSQLVAEKAIYRLSFVTQPNEPVITASVQAPTPQAAAKVGNAIYPGVQSYVAQIQKQSNTPEEDRVTIRELGPVQAGTVNGGSRMTLMIAAFLGILIAGLLSILAVEGIRRRDRELEQIESDLAVQLAGGLEGPAAQKLTPAGERRR